MVLKRTIGVITNDSPASIEGVTVPENLLSEKQGGKHGHTRKKWPSLKYTLFLE